jgi:hypothetical protein
MEENGQIDTHGSAVTRGGTLGAAKAASTICLLAGIWLFISPWVYGAYMNGNAWNSWIVGALLAIFGLARISRNAYSAVLSWFSVVLGVWTFCSPWIYGYAGTNTGRFINSLCVGFIVFVFAIASARPRGSRLARATRQV